MSSPMTAPQVLDREFLEIRARILQLAADLDRLDRSAGSVAADARLDLIRRGLNTLLEEEDGRAERIQLIFSRAYQPTWQKDFFS